MSNDSCSVLAWPHAARRMDASYGHCSFPRRKWQLPLAGGVLMDVVVWLRSLGLEEYEATFRDNKIDERVVPNLTQEDLKEIGVGPVGHRRILLEAIAALRNKAEGKAPFVDAVATLSAPSAHPEDRAERRQVTVMFSDLVGS